MSGGTDGSQPGRGVWVERLALLLFAVTASVVVGEVLTFLAPVLGPVLLSLLIAYVLDPVIDWFEARGVSRPVSITLVAFVSIAAAGLFLGVVVPTLVTEVGRAGAGLPTWAAERYAWVRDRLQEHVEISTEQLETAAMSALAAAQGVVRTLLAGLAGQVNSLLNAVLIPVFVFYFLRDFDRIKVLPLTWIPTRFHPAVLDRAVRMDTRVGQWIRGQVKVGMILAILYAVGLQVVGIRLAIPIGLMAGLLNVVPYFGALTGIVLSVLMALTSGDPVTQLIGVAIVFAVVQFLEGYLITPKLVGDAVEMSPLTVILVLLVGGSLFGFAGLLLAVPVAAALRVLEPDWRAWLQGTRWWRGPSRTGSTGGEGPSSEGSSPSSEVAPEGSSSASEAPPVGVEAAVGEVQSTAEGLADPAVEADVSAVGADAGAETPAASAPGPSGPGNGT